MFNNQFGRGQMQQNQFSNQQQFGMNKQQQFVNNQQQQFRGNMNQMNQNQMGGNMNRMNQMQNMPQRNMNQMSRGNVMNRGYTNQGNMMGNQMGRGNMMMNRGMMNQNMMGNNNMGNMRGNMQNQGMKNQMNQNYGNQMNQGMMNQQKGMMNQQGMNQQFGNQRMNQQNNMMMNNQMSGGMNKFGRGNMNQMGRGNMMNQNMNQGNMNNPMNKMNQQNMMNQPNQMMKQQPQNMMSNQNVMNQNQQGGMNMTTMNQQNMMKQPNQMMNQQSQNMMNQGMVKQPQQQPQGMMNQGMVKQPQQQQQGMMNQMGTNQIMNQQNNMMKQPQQVGLSKPQQPSNQMMMNQPNQMMNQQQLGMNQMQNQMKVQQPQQQGGRGGGMMMNQQIGVGMKSKQQNMMGACSGQTNPNSNKFLEQLNRQAQSQVRIQSGKTATIKNPSAPRTGTGGGSWQSTNIGGIGSKQDLALRIQTAKKEEEWKGAGLKEGIEIWRVENFGVKRWSRGNEFFNGDCFIVLNTYGHTRSFRYDVFYWIGSESTVDEKGTAALKTIELDDYFGTIPVQYRECEGHESQKFLSLFAGGLRILKGGIDSGFRKVEKEKFVPRLLHVKGRKYVRCIEVTKRPESLNNGDVFLLDLGEKVFVWAGSKCNPQEKYKAGQVFQDIKNKRAKVRVQREDVEEEGSPEFWMNLGVGQGMPVPKVMDESQVQSDTDFEQKKTVECSKKLFQLSDVTGQMQFSLVQEVQPNVLLDSSKLDHDDVFIIDLGTEIIAWIGKGASKDERKQAILYATNYLTKSKKPDWCRICRIEDGREGPKWRQIFK